MEDSLSTTPVTVKSKSQSPFRGVQASPSLGDTTQCSVGNVDFFCLHFDFSRVQFLIGFVIIAVIKKPIMDWNYEDFGCADHRVQLYCDLSLFNEPEEDLLIIVKVGQSVQTGQTGLLQAVDPPQQAIWTLKTGRITQNRPNHAKQAQYGC